MVTFENIPFFDPGLIIGNEVQVPLNEIKSDFEKLIKIYSEKPCEQIYPADNPTLNSLLLMVGICNEDEFHNVIQDITAEDKIVAQKYYTAFQKSYNSTRIARIFQKLKDKIHDKLMQSSSQNSANESSNGNVQVEILQILDAIKPDKLDQAKMLDLYFTANTFFRIVDKQTDDNEIIQAIHKFLELRETVLQGDSHDYCTTRSEANFLCAKIVTSINPHQEFVLSTLLTRARTNNRATPWQDYITMSSDLPENPGLVFRSEDGRIHSYEGVLAQAISRLKAGASTKHLVFMGTDRRNDDDPALQPADLRILRQRAQTFTELIDYVERLEAANEANNMPISDRFQSLRGALLLGDVSHNGKEKKAGWEANVGIAKFASWWNDLSKTENGKPIQEQICALDNGNLKKVIDIILDTDTKDRNNPQYCIQLKGNLLEGAITNEEVLKKFQELDKRVTWRMSNEQLAQWASKITQELLSPFLPMTTGENIFKKLLENTDFIRNVSKDSSIDYFTLFQHANKSILWKRRREDGGKESMLYHAVKNKIHEGYVEFLLTYHIAHYAENPLAYVLALLFDQNRLKLISLLLQKTTYPLKKMKKKLVGVEFNKTIEHINFEKIKLLIQGANLIDYSDIFLDSITALAEKKIEFFLENFQSPVDSELIDNIFACLVTINTESKFDNILYLILSKWPALLNHSTIPQIFETKALKTNSMSIPLFQLLLKNEKAAAKLEDEKIAVSVLKNVQLRKHILSASTEEAIIPNEKMKHWFIFFCRSNGNEVAMDILKSQPTLAFAYYKAERSSLTMIDGIPKEFYFVLTQKPINQELLALFVFSKDFAEVIKECGHAILLKAIETQNDIVFYEIMERHFSCVKKESLISGLRYYLEKNELNSKAKLLLGLILKHYPEEIGNITKQNNWDKLVFNSIDIIDLEKFKLFFCKSEITTKMKVSLNEIKEKNASIYDYLIKEQLHKISDDSLIEHLLSQMAANHFQSKHLFFIIKWRPELFKIEANARIVLTLFKLVVSKENYHESNLFLLLDTLGSKYLRECLDWVSTNNPHYNKLIEKYSHQLTLPEVSTIFNRLKSVNRLDILTTLLDQQKQDTLSALLAYEVSHHSLQHLNIINLFVKRLRPFDDISFNNFTSLISGSYNNKDFIKFILDYDENLADNLEEPLFTLQQRSLLQASFSSIVQKPDFKSVLTSAIEQYKNSSQATHELTDYFTNKIIKKFEKVTANVLKYNTEMMNLEQPLIRETKHYKEISLKELEQKLLKVEKDLESLKKSNVQPKESKRHAFFSSVSKKRDKVINGAHYLQYFFNQKITFIQMNFEQSVSIADNLPTYDKFLKLCNQNIKIQEEVAAIKSETCTNENTPRQVGWVKR